MPTHARRRACGAPPRTPVPSSGGRCARGPRASDRNDEGGPRAALFRSRTELELPTTATEGDAQLEEELRLTEAPPERERPRRARSGAPAPGSNAPPRRTAKPADPGPKGGREAPKTESEIQRGDWPRIRSAVEKRDLASLMSSRQQVRLLPAQLSLSTWWPWCRRSAFGVVIPAAPVRSRPATLVYEGVAGRSVPVIG